MSEFDSRAELMDAAVKHIADRLAITYSFAERKLKQFLMNKVIKEGGPIADTELLELAEEVVLTSLRTERKSETRSSIAQATEDASHQSFISAVHHHQLQQENTRLKTQVDRLLHDKRILTGSLTAAQALADSSAGEVEGLRSSVEIMVSELLKRVGPVTLPLQNNIHTDKHTQEGQRLHG